MVKIEEMLDKLQNLIVFIYLFFFTGVIYTKEPNLDRETKSTYEIVVQAKDAPGFSGDSSTATVIITLSDINDNFPVFKHSECHTASEPP